MQICNLFLDVNKGHKIFGHGNKNPGGWAPSEKNTYSRVCSCVQSFAMKATWTIKDIICDFQQQSLPFSNKQKAKADACHAFASQAFIWSRGFPPKVFVKTWKSIFWISNYYYNWRYWNNELDTLWLSWGNFQSPGSILTNDTSVDRKGPWAST